jgi:hypothetical protein
MLACKDIVVFGAWQKDWILTLGVVKNCRFADL